MSKSFVLAVVTCSTVLLWPAPSSADNTVQRIAGNPVLIAQQTIGQQIDITGKLRTAPDGRVYQIQNLGQWSSEEWFDSNTTVRIIGNLRSDTVKATLTASQITHVKVSEVQNTGDRVRDEIQRQIDKQVSGNRINDLLRRIPFLGRFLERFDD
jgi:hypothetical protein